MKLPRARAAVVVLSALSLAGTGSAQDPLWIRQFGTGAPELARVAAPDGAGGLYVTGETWGSLGGPAAGGSDLWIARYDADGQRSWIRQFGTPESDNAPAVVAADGGGVFVAGQTLGALQGSNAGGFDVFVARYDGAGHQLWVRQFGSSASEGALAAVSDGSDGVIVGGSTRGLLGGPSGGSLSDVWFARYDGAGNRLWILQLAGIGDELCKAGAGDGVGGFYLAGDTNDTLVGGPADSLDGWVARFGAAGGMLWRRQFGSSLPDGVSSLAPDAAGGIYVAGITYGAFGAPNAGLIDAWVARHDVLGNQLWLRQFGTAGFDQVFGSAPDGSGGVWVCGESTGALGGANAGASDPFLAHYDSAGNQVSLLQFGTATYEHASSAAADDAGGVFLTGQTQGALGAPNAGAQDAWIARFDGLEPTTFCPQTAPNSTGRTSGLSARGSALVAANQLVLTAEHLPSHALGVFLVSRTQGFPVMPGGSQGDLCLAGNVGRFLAPGQVASAGAAGVLRLAVDLSAVPTPTGTVSVTPGETWNFQAWHRDANSGPTSNFTDAVSIRLR